MATLLLIRHGMSEWNKRGVWTGQTDVPLAPEGYAEAKRAADAIAGIRIDKAYVSKLERAEETFECIEVALHKQIPEERDAALNERDYGEYTGKNKWEMEKKVGEEEFERIRRGWNVCVPGGETLKDVYERIVPYFESHILPDLKAGKNVLVVAHGNSLRALIKRLEHISDEDVCNIELGVGSVHSYSFDEAGNMTGKEVKTENETKGHI